MDSLLLILESLVIIINLVLMQKSFAAAAIALSSVNAVDLESKSKMTGLVSHLTE